MQSTPIRAAIGAAATVPNALAGTALEYFGQAATLSLYGNADIAGMSMSLSFNRGGDSDLPIPPGSSLGVASTVGKVKTNEDFIGQWAVPAGSRLVLSVTNPGAASNYTFLLMAQ